MFLEKCLTFFRRVNDVPFVAECGFLENNVPSNVYRWIIDERKKGRCSVFEQRPCVSGV